MSETPAADSTPTPTAAAVPAAPAAQGGTWGDDDVAPPAAPAAATTAAAAAPAAAAVDVDALTAKLAAATTAAAGPGPAAAAAGAAAAAPAETKAAEETKAPDELPQDLDELLAYTGGLTGEHSARLEVIQQDETSRLYSASTFQDLGLPQPLLDGVFGMNFDRPSQIQTVALPLLCGETPKNLIGQAQSGSGKTAAFVLAMLFRVDPAVQQVQALCICPTRELARQIMAVVSVMGKFVLTSPSHKQLAIAEAVGRNAKVTAPVVVGNPGTVEGLIKKKKMLTQHIKIFVLDEADVLVEEGRMRDQTMSIKKKLPRTCQTVLFSATYADNVMEFARRVVDNPNIIRVRKEELALDEIQQAYIDCRTTDKMSVLHEIYAFLEVGQSVVFVQRRETAKQLYRDMTARGHTVSLIHGADMEKSERDRVIDDFRLGRAKVLISTNLLARGIDVLGVSLVINYDLPLTREGEPDMENYLHRIGRTGRFGRTGSAINFVGSDADLVKMRAFQEFYGREIAEVPADPEQIGSALGLE